MNKDNSANKLLEALSLFGSGIVAGFTFYITIIELPGRNHMPAKFQLQNYHKVFPLAAGFMKPFGMVLSSITALTLFSTKKKTWIIPLLAIGALGPFTAIVIQPTNEKLMGTDEKDADKVEQDLKEWGSLHNIRTYLSLVGFAGAVAAGLGKDI